MPRSRAAIGLNSRPARPASRTPTTMPTTGGSRRTNRGGRRGGAAAAAAGAGEAPAGAERVSDTGQLLGPEQAGGADQQHDDHHDVGRDLAEAAAQERQLVLVPGGERLGDADEQAADQRAAGGVQATE